MIDKKEAKSAYKLSKKVGAVVAYKNEERGDAFWGIPKLSCLVLLEFYLGVTWASPSLGSCHSLLHSPSNLYPKLENFTAQNSTENS